MDEGGEALSPLVAAKAQAQVAAAQAGAAAAAAAMPGSGSVGGTPRVLPRSVAPAASSERAGPSGAQQQHHHPQQQQAAAHGQASAGKGASGAANGYAVHDGPSSAAGAAAVASQGVASPIDYSTMAVDLAPVGPADAPQPSASFQPSSLPPPGAVAAALAALEAAQAAQNGSLWQTPPPAAAEQLGEAIQALARQASGALISGRAGLGSEQQWPGVLLASLPMECNLLPIVCAAPTHLPSCTHFLLQNGYATHANSAIGNGHVATSPGVLRVRFGCQPDCHEPVCAGVALPTCKG